jgi:putative membrane protein insertion efficiency factor
MPIVSSGAPRSRGFSTGKTARKGAALAVAFLVFIILDLRRAPVDQWSARASIAAIHGYQATLSPWYTRAGVQCRFTPSCSHYGEAVIRRFGAAKGGWLAMKRVLRCGPWTARGTVDPPPL